VTDLGCLSLGMLKRMNDKEGAGWECAEAAAICGMDSWCQRFCFGTNLMQCSRRWLHFGIVRLCKVDLESRWIEVNIYV
jgi:hypothetical protein